MDQFEVMEDLEEMAEPRADETDAAYAGLVNQLKKSKDKAVAHKSEVEQRWIEDERQYWGFRAGMTEDETEESEAPPLDNKTRVKVDTAAARAADMLVPTNDRNWSLTNTPRPTNIDGMEIDPKEAKQAADEAENIIDDYLNQCEYHKHCRQAIHDSFRIGVGVIKGPYSRMSSRRVVRRELIPMTDITGMPVPQIDETGNLVLDEMGMPLPQITEAIRLEILKEINPASTRVDPWMFFPMPCRSMSECEGVFELHLYGRSRLTKLREHPDFRSDAVERLAATSPRLTDAESSLMRERRKMLRNHAGEDVEEFVVWEYHGPIEASVLEKIGYGLGEHDSRLDMYWGEVWFSNDEILKIDINAILGDERVPYYVVPYCRDDADIMNSYGLCRVMRDDQRTIDIVYEAMQYNTRLCSGPQVVYWEGKAYPVNQKYTVDGPMTWRVTDDEVRSIDDVIQFRNIESSIPAMMPMYELARQNADENSQMPMMAMGEATNVHPTASGIATLMNASNIVQRRFAHAWDDEITIPMLTRYYWWLMEFHDDDSIKVEMEVDPRGASYLLVKDQQAQHGMLALQLYERFPSLQQRIKEDELVDIVFNFLDVPTDQIFRTEEEMEDQQNSPQVQMQMQAAQAEIEEKMASAQEARARAMKAEAEAMAAAQPEQDQSAMLEFQRDQMRYQAQMAEIEARLIIAQMERDARLAQAAGNQQIKLSELQAKLQTQEQDRQFKAWVEQMRMQQKEMEAQRRQFTEGMKTRVAMERKQLRERQYDLREQNMQQGHDSW